MPMIEPPDAFLRGFHDFDDWVRVDCPADRALSFACEDWDFRASCSHARKEWIKENTKDLVMSPNEKFYFFKDPKEAILFKMVIHTL
jgi:hypothetical protein